MRRKRRGSYDSNGGRILGNVVIIILAALLLGTILLLTGIIPLDVGSWKNMLFWSGVVEGCGIIGILVGKAAGRRN